MQYQQMLSWVRAHAASAGLAATLAFVLLYAVASLWLPFGWDHGMMAEVGDIMWRGGVIYRDAWDLKGPLAYVPFWLTTTLFGHTMWGIRLFEIILLAPCLYLLMRRVAAFTNFTTGAAAALALYLWIVSVGGFFFTAQPEIWTAAFAALATLVLMRRAGAPAPTSSVHAASGALIALCVLVKPHFVVLAVAPMMAIASAQDVDFRRKSRQAIAFGGGLATPLLIAAIWLAGAGAWDAFIEAHITFNLTSYAGAPGGWFGVAFGVLEFLRQPALAVLGPLGLVGLWDRRREASVAGPLLALMLTALIVVVLQGKLFVYHWFVIYPPIVIAAALGAHALWTQARAAPLIQALLTGAAIAFAAQVTLPPARVVVRWVRLQMGQFGDNYYDGYNLHAYVATDIVRAASCHCMGALNRLHRARSSPSHPPEVSSAARASDIGKDTCPGAAINTGRQSGPNLAL